jgi:hypothetical protein
VIIASEFRKSVYYPQNGIPYLLIFGITTSFIGNKQLSLVKVEHNLKLVYKESSQLRFSDQDIYISPRKSGFASWEIFLYAVTEILAVTEEELLWKDPIQQVHLFV